MREGRGQPQSGPSPLESVIGGGPTASPTPLLRPAPRALADLAGAGALHSEARGGAGPPHTAALRHESPPPPGTLGQGRGAHSLYLAGLDLILPRGGLQSLQSPRPQSPPWSHLVWFGGRGSSFLLSVSSSFLPTVVCLSVLVSLFSVPWSSLPPTAVDFLVYFCPVSLSLLIPSAHHLPGRSHKGPDSSLCLPRPHNKSPHRQNPKTKSLYRSRDPPPQQN